MQLTEKQFNNLYKTYNSKISRYVTSKINNREDAEELVGDVFIKVNQRYHLFDEKKSQLATWIYNIAKNVLIDYFRKKKYHMVSINVNDIDEDSDFAEHVEIADTDLNPLDAYIRNERIELIKDKLSDLNTLERKLITMYAIEGYTYNEIVDQLDVPLGTVKGTIHRARNIMREFSPVII